jgi:hypothetical protein
MNGRGDEVRSTAGKVTGQGKAPVTFFARGHVLPLGVLLPRRENRQEDTIQRGTLQAHAEPPARTAASHRRGQIPATDANNNEPPARRTTSRRVYPGGPALPATGSTAKEVHRGEHRGHEEEGSDMGRTKAAGARHTLSGRACPAAGARRGLSLAKTPRSPRRNDTGQCSLPRGGSLGTRLVGPRCREEIAGTYFVGPLRSWRLGENLNN